MTDVNIFERLKHFSYETEEEYRGDMDCVSSHFLMSFSGNKFEKNEGYAYRPYFTQGHLLEQLIFEEEHEKALQEEYKIVDFVPSETMQKLIAAYIGSEFSHNLKTREEQSNKLVLLIAENKLWNNIKKLDKIKDKFDIPEFWDYIDNLFDPRGKKVLSSEQYMVVQSAADRVRDMSIFMPFQGGANVNNRQYLIHPMYKTDINLFDMNFKARAQLDMLIYDPVLNKIVIIDFKTTSNTAGQFGMDYKRYKYYIQSYWYVKVLENYIKQFTANVPRIEFSFAVVSKTHQNEKALLIQDVLASQYLPEYTKHGINFNKEKLFNNLNKVLRIKNRNIKNLIEGVDSPIAVMSHYAPSITDLL